MRDLGSRALRRAGSNPARCTRALLVMLCADGVTPALLSQQETQSGYHDLLRGAEPRRLMHRAVLYAPVVGQQMTVWQAAWGSCRTVG